MNQPAPSPAASTGARLPARRPVTGTTTAGDRLPHLVPLILISSYLPHALVSLHQQDTVATGARRRTRRQIHRRRPRVAGEAPDRAPGGWDREARERRARSRVCFLACFFSI